MILSARDLKHVLVINFTTMSTSRATKGMMAMPSQKSQVEKITVSRSAIAAPIGKAGHERE